MPTSPSLLSEGLVVADTYEIERLLGLGGMGEVWLARHRRLSGKQVAVKVLRTGGQLGAEAWARFRREAEIAARLEHPNIVQVLDYNTLPTGEPFLVMEALKGESLAARLRLGPLALEQVQQVVRQVGSALQAAHAHGIVHRDLKPENVFLIPTALGDQVKVLDFGISKLADSSSLVTTESVLIGTPLYMSPEQATGNNREVTPQSDVFSLGSICYELLTGQAPFASDSVAKIVFRIAYENHQPLSRCAPNLPPEVVAAVEHALVKDRAARTPTIDAFVLEFTGQPLGSSSTSGVYRPGMKVSESMMGATMAPGSGLSPQATPLTSGVLPTEKEPEARRRRLGLALGGVAVTVAAGLLGAWVASQRGASGNTQPTIRFDAGVVSAPGSSLGDTGPDAAVELPRSDAGRLDGAEGAAVAVGSEAPNQRPDAGPPPSPRLAEVSFTERDAKSLAEMKRLAAGGNWEELYSRFRSRAMSFDTPAAKRQALTQVGLAACRLHDLVGVTTQINRLDNLGERSAAADLRARCRKAWPDFGG